MRNTTQHNPETLRLVTFLSLLALAVLIGSALIGQGVVADSVDANQTFELGDGVDPLVPGVGDIAGNTLQPGPDWDDLFNADRSLKDVYDDLGQPGSNGLADYLDTYSGRYKLRRDAGFIFDDVSAGSATDGSVFVGPGSVGAGTVEAAYDLGNAYAYGAFDNYKNLILYVGVERLTSGSARILFEFNRNLFELDAAGAIVGQRAAGDILVRADFPGGILYSVDVSKWGEPVPGSGEFDWISLETLPINPDDPAEQCNAAGTLCSVCNSLAVDGGAWPNFDSAGNPSASLLAGSFMEFGINLSAVLGIHDFDNYYRTRYASIQISTDDGAPTPTAHDYALGNFGRATQVARSRP